LAFLCWLWVIWGGPGCVGHQHSGVEASCPRAAGLYHPIRWTDNVVKEIYGRNTGDATAKISAAELKAGDDFLVARMNKHGASIHENPKRKLGQEQDRAKLRRHAKKLGKVAAREEWLKDHLDNLDWDVMEYEGAAVLPANRREVLNKSYDTIFTEGNIKIKPGQTDRESLAGKLSRARFFYYKSPEAWITMQKKYGAGDAYKQMLGSLETRARDVAMLEVFGPDPANALNFVRKLADLRAAQIELDPKTPVKFKSMKAAVTQKMSVLNDRYRMHNHMVSNGSESVMAQGLGAARMFTQTALLDAAFLPNMGDLGFAANAALGVKLPAIRAIARIVKVFAQMPSSQMRREMIIGGGGFDSVVQIGLAYQKYHGPLDGPMFLKRAADVNFRLTLLTPLVQAEIWSNQQMFFRAFADFADRSFDNLPNAKMLSEAGITAKDWDIFRKTAVYDPEGYSYLRPIDVLDRTDLSKVERERISDLFFDFVLDNERKAVSFVDTEVRASLGQGLDADTVPGMVMRLFGSVKSFAMAVMLIHLKDIATKPTLGGKLGALARLTIILTISGAFITQAQEMVLYGRDPMDMRKPVFWLRSLLNGGSLGLLGNVILGGAARYRSGGPSEEFAGPVVGFLGDTLDLGSKDFSDFIQGKETHVTRNLLRYGQKYTPVPWQMRLLLQRAIMDDLLYLTDPDAYRRAQARARKLEFDTGQEYWWPMGDEPRAPDFGAAIRGE